MISLMIAAIVAVVGFGWAHYFNVADSRVEQTAEIIIKAETGLEIDLSADMKDKDTKK